MKWELEDYQEINIPFLSIQPLVENAVHHGIRKGDGKGSVVIRIKKRLYPFQSINYSRR